MKTPAYNDVADLIGDDDSTSLGRWEQASLSALRARALYRDALMHGDPFVAADYYSLYNLDRAAAREARRRAGH